MMESAPVLVEAGGEGLRSVEVTSEPLLYALGRCKGKYLHNKRVVLFDSDISAIVLGADFERMLVLKRLTARTRTV
jgi:hypothetical protein